MRINEIENTNEDRGTYVAARFTEETTAALAAYQEAIGIPNPLSPADFHSTIVYSRKSIFWRPEVDIEVESSAKGLKIWDTKDGTKCCVLLLESPYLQVRFQVAMDRGATYDFPDYIPHVTLSYDVGDFDIQGVPLPEFPIVIDEEYVKALDE